MSARYVVEDQKRVRQMEAELPVAGKFDVIVAGGGTAGVAAAVCAARLGARTLLVERNGYVGGVTTGALMGVMWATADGLSGFSRETLDRLLKVGGAQEGNIIPFDPEAMKHVLSDLLEESGVHLLLYSGVADVIAEDGRIRGIVVESKAGRQAFLADVVIDASGDGDVAALAGAPFQKGRRDGKMRPMTLIFRIGNIDLDPLVAYATTNPDQFIADSFVNIVDPGNQFLRLAGFFDLVRKARERGDLDKNIFYLRVESVWFKKRMALINTTRIYDVDGTDPWDVSRAQLALLKQVKGVEAFLRSDVPGFSEAFVIDTAPMIGIRETRHILGKHLLEEDEILANTFFPDAIYRHTAHMPAGFQTHSPDGREAAPGDAAYVQGWPARSHSVPYGCLVVERVKNLLVAGRCISATHEADEWTRHIPVCFATGQAAGTAAALSIAAGRSLDQIPFEDVQAELTRQGVQIR